jgi:hypothetical protein
MDGMDRSKRRPTHEYSPAVNEHANEVFIDWTELKVRDKSHGPAVHYRPFKSSTRTHNTHIPRPGTIKHTTVDILRRI